MDGWMDVNIYVCARENVDVCMCVCVYVLMSEKQNGKTSKQTKLIVTMASTASGRSHKMVTRW